MAGRGVGRLSENSQLVPLRGYGWKVIAALSVTGAERTSPGMASGLSPMTRPHKESSLPPGLGGNGGEKESLLRDCLACKAPRGREDGGYQKIVVSYLVLIPLLASCPGSTIHGRLARVFCSDGSICFKTERHRLANAYAGLGDGFGGFVFKAFWKGRGMPPFSCL